MGEGEGKGGERVEADIVGLCVQGVVGFVSFVVFVVRLRVFVVLSCLSSFVAVLFFRFPSFVFVFVALLFSVIILIIVCADKQHVDFIHVVITPFPLCLRILPNHANTKIT